MLKFRIAILGGPMIDIKERYVVTTKINNGMVVFDVGVHQGEWANLVLTTYKNITLHTFDPIAGIMDTLTAPLSNLLVKNYVAISNTTGEKQFYIYPRVPELSTLYRRNSKIEAQFNLTPVVQTVKLMTLDAYTAEHNISTIDFLKIDVEGGEMDVLLGAQRLLQNKAIHRIQFEYGGCNLDSGTTLQQLYEFLTRYGYCVYQQDIAALIPITEFRTELEDYQWSNYFAEVI